jgi:hypothetical protein
LKMIWKSVTLWRKRYDLKIIIASKDFGIAYEQCKNRNVKLTI